MSLRLLPLLLLLTTSLAGCADDDAPTTTCANAPTRASLKLQNASNPVVVWNTTMGCFAAELYIHKTPITAGNFLNLTKSGFYDGTRFHRVIGPEKDPPQGFIIQDGDPNSKSVANNEARAPNGWGFGGPGYTIPDEFPCKDGFVSNSHPAQCSNHGGLFYRHDKKGILSMANSGPASGGSQYFFTLVPTPHLDGMHAIFGQVVWNIAIVDAIGNTPTDEDHRPLSDVINRSVYLL